MIWIAISNVSKFSITQVSMFLILSSIKSMKRSKQNKNHIPLFYTQKRQMGQYKIAILGIGGVGGYLGGMLAAANNKETEIVFIARTQTKETIKRAGLKLIINDTG